MLLCATIRHPTPMCSRGATGRASELAQAALRLYRHVAISAAATWLNVRAAVAFVVHVNRRTCQGRRRSSSTRPSTSTDRPRLTTTRWIRRVYTSCTIVGTYFRRAACKEMLVHVCVFCVCCHAIYSGPQSTPLFAHSPVSVTQEER